MKLLVCGGRNFTDEAFVFAALDKVHARKPVSMLIHGGARGADTLAGKWAVVRGIHSAQVSALWDANGKAAGPLRNVAMMTLHPDVVVAFPGGSGTAHMADLARRHGLKVWEPKP